MTVDHFDSENTLKYHAIRAWVYLINASATGYHLLVRLFENTYQDIPLRYALNASCGIPP